MLPVPPSFDKTSIVYRLQPLDGDAPNSLVFVFLFCELSKDSLHTEMETRLQAPEDLSGFSHGFGGHI